MFLLKKRTIFSLRNFCFSTIKQHRQLYLDMQATTPVDFRVTDSMLPYLTSLYGNPHSRTHEYGWETENAIEKSRAQVASLIKADPKEIIFVSGATEASNLALRGLTSFYDIKKKNHIITTEIVTYLPVNSKGLIDLNLMKKTINEKTLCVSVMHVNNEIGVFQSIGEIGKICRENKVYFHTDCAQSIGKLRIDVNEMNIDLMSITAHKVYGPKGVGALYVRRKPRVRILRIFSLIFIIAIISGGGQERGLRSGTLPPALIVGLGAACEVAEKNMENDSQHIKIYEGNLHISFPNLDNESFISSIKKCAVSAGSACINTEKEISYVLKAIGLKGEIARSSIRIGLGRFTTEEEIDLIINELTNAVERIGKL